MKDISDKIKDILASSMSHSKTLNKSCCLALFEVSGEGISFNTILSIRMLIKRYIKPNASLFYYSNKKGISVVFPESELLEVSKIVNNILRDLKELYPNHDSFIVVGIAHSSTDKIHNVNELFERAELALNKAKKNKTELACYDDLNFL